MEILKNSRRPPRNNGQYEIDYGVIIMLIDSTKLLRYIRIRDSDSALKVQGWIAKYISELDTRAAQDLRRWNDEDNENTVKRRRR